MVEIMRLVLHIEKWESDCSREYIDSKTDFHTLNPTVVPLGQSSVEPPSLPPHFKQT